MTEALEPAFATGNYQEALSKLADLREPVDAFFDNVMVMADDEALWGCLPHFEVEFHAMLVTFLLSLALRFSTSSYGCHQLAKDPGVPQQVTSINPSKHAICSFVGCLTHPIVEFHGMLVTFLSSLVLHFSTSCYG